MHGVVWAPLFLLWAWGKGAKMCRLGSAKPGSWASFWAMLTLVGLVTGPSGSNCPQPGGGGVQTAGPGTVLI